ncbi:MAG TPA: hypothetical protein VKI17_09935, partial [Gemmataceae bacterium]|nr:hypothetical protein [Gemmataceae bacterium]
MLSERLLQLLTAYVDGGVTAHQRRVVLRYLRTSAEARSFLKKLQDDANELRQLPVRKLGRDLSQTILQRIGDQVVVRPIRIPMEQAPSPVPRGFGLATAAAVLLALGFGSVYYLKAIREKDALVAVAVVPPESSSNGLTPNDDKVTDSKIEVAKAPNPKAATPITVAKIDEKKQEQPPASSSIKDTGPVFTMPVPPPPDHFEIANVKVAMNLPSRDVLQENRRQQLLERLRKEDAQHIDLYCKQTRAALERVERAFKEQGIDFVLAPDAIQPYLFRSRNTDYVLFTESVKPEEVLTVLRQVADQDQALESTHKGKAQFQDVLVNAVSKRDH